MLVDLRVQMAGHAPDRGGTRMCRDRVQCLVNQPLHLLEVLLHSSCNRRLRTQTLVYTHQEVHLQRRRNAMAAKMLERVS